MGILLNDKSLDMIGKRTGGGGDMGAQVLSVEDVQELSGQAGLITC